MTVELLYFANLKEALGLDREHVRLEQQASTVRQLLDALCVRHPAISAQLAGVRVAVNEEFCDAAHSLSDGDVVALIPPVSGG